VGNLSRVRIAPHKLFVLVFLPAVAVLLIMWLVPAAVAGSSHLPSAFDEGAEGWTVTGDAEGSFGNEEFDLQAPFTLTEGNPGGAIVSVDTARDFVIYFQAPSRFLGNQSGVFGMTLTYDVKLADQDVVFDAPDVVLAGGGTTLLTNAGTPAPDVWTTYSVPLDETGDWRLPDGSPATREDIRTVLRSLDVLRIRGEYGYGPDTGYLDNVRIAP
jgi:coxsackievirus/adenovirus receptor